MRKLQSRVVQRDGKSRERDYSYKISQPFARFLLFWRGESGGGTACADGKRKGHPVDDGTQEQTVQTDHDGRAADQT